MIQVRILQFDSHRFMFRLDEVAPLTIKFLSGQSNDTQLYFNETGLLKHHLEWQELFGIVIYY